jgi:tetratricopeptide (TPR) repeat protein
MKERSFQCVPLRLAQLARAVAILLIFTGGSLHADDVNLVQGAKFEKAIGGRVRGQVQSESAKEVVVQLGASTIQVPTELIQSIRYDGQSATFALGEARESAGQLAEAADLFKKAAADSADKPYPQQAALFREAEVLTDLAAVEPDRIKDAKDRLTKFVRQYPTSRHTLGARVCLARIQLASGDFPAAQSAIADLAKFPTGVERAAVLRTKLLAKQNKHKEAIDELDKLIGSSAKGSERLRAAQLAKAESLAALKDFTKAEALLHEVIKATPPEDAAGQAPAYNTLGDCLRAANRPKDALLAYLHTDQLYSKDKEEHPRALHQISVIFRQLKLDGRADEFAQRLKTEYPHSRWAAAKSDEG